MFNSVDLKFASGAKSTEALLCDLGRYDLHIQPVRRIRSHNVYSLASVARAYLLGALQQQQTLSSQQLSQLATHSAAQDQAIQQMQQAHAFQSPIPGPAGIDPSI